MEEGTLSRLPCTYTALTMSISLNCTSLVLHLPHSTPNLGVEDSSNPEGNSLLLWSQAQDAFIFIRVQLIYNVLVSGV